MAQIANNFGFQPLPAQNNFGFEPIPETTHQSVSDWLMGNVAKPAAAAIPDILSGIASGTRDMINFPLQVAGVPQRYQIPQTMNLTQAAGLPQNPGLQEMASFAPTVIGSEIAAPLSAAKSLSPLLAKMATEGATFQATQTPNDPYAVAQSAAINALIPSGMAGGKELLVRGAERFGLPQFADNSLESIKGLMGLSNREALNLAEKNYGLYEGKKKNLWENLDSVAKIADANLPKQGLDTTAFREPIQDRINELEKLSAQHTGYKNAYEEPIKILKSYLNDDINTFESAFTQNKALNKDYRASLRTNSGAPKSRDELDATKFAIDSLHNMIDQNLENLGLSGSLGNIWNDARQTTTDINQIFKTVPDIGGNAKTSLFQQHQLSNNPYIDPTTFVSNYVPRGKGEGIESMEQFAKMIGDEKSAKDFLKANFFEKVLQGGNPSARDFIGRANTLSEKQKSYLFTPEEKQQMKLVSGLMDKYPDNQPVQKILDALFHGGTGGVVGGAAAHAIGAPWYYGSLAGGIGVPAAEHAAYSIAGNKNVNNLLQKMLINRMNNPAPMAGNIAANTARATTAQQPFQGALSNG